MSYKIGDRVPKTGKYRCVNCDTVETFEAEEEFPDCETCFTGGTHTSDDEMGWELAMEDPTMD